MGQVRGAGGRGTCREGLLTVTYKSQQSSPTPGYTSVLCSQELQFNIWALAYFLLPFLVIFCVIPPLSSFSLERDQTLRLM